MLVIHPDECIDCGVCVPECPADAIVSDTEPAATDQWLELNRTYADLWPNIIARKAALPDADSHNGRQGKIAEFSPQPASEIEADTGREQENLPR